MKRILVVVVAFGLGITGMAFALTRGSQPMQGGGLEITGHSWKWIKTQMNDDTLITPNKSDAFTITFTADGQVLGTTDCNNFRGSYTLTDDKLTFGPLASTKMFCEGSQETVFLTALGQVDGVMLDAQNNQLVLLIKFDSGTMIFEPATTAE